MRSSNKASIRSHTKPRAYLQRFAVPDERAKGKLWVYERGKAPRMGTPKSEAAERGFFRGRLRDGSFDDRPFEAWAQKIEDRALESLLHAPNPCFVWTRASREHMADYWALLFLRNSASFHFHRQYWKERLTKNWQRVTTDPEVRKRLAVRYSRRAGRPITGEEVVQTFGRVIPNLLGEGEVRDGYVQRLQERTSTIRDILIAKPWQIWAARGQAEFVTCDSPVTTLLFEPDGRYYVGYGFGRPGVVPIMPISPSACLVAGIAGPAHRFVRDEDIWEINKALISCSLRFTYSRKQSQHVDSLVQQFASSIRYGIDAFKSPETDDLFDLFG